MADDASRTPHLARVERLNTLWRVAGAEPAGGSLPRRLLFAVRRLLASLLRPQETFNAAVVEYINGTAVERQRLDDLVTACREAVDEALRHQESLAARERRIEAGMQAVQTAQQELRTSLGALQQATQALKHEVTRLAAQGPAAGTAPAPTSATAEPTAAPAASRVAAALSTHTYVGFEDQFRGDPAAIRTRLAGYVPLFAGAAPVLDVGCGRGEFLALLREQGIDAVGIDTNASMVRVCGDKGLRAEEADALGFLRRQPDASLGGLFAAQVVEHLDPAYLQALLETAFDKLRPGAPLVLETINPACWFAFFESYIRDVTHVRPLHPDTLRYMLVAAGFQRLSIRYEAPYPEHEKLQPITAHGVHADTVDILNGNVEKINRLLFTYLDYAAIGYRP